uniref:Uncharacterized protein n=1 Tax=Kalanchoe fedtschenkoi TaxID=63787 RepID=A0A7N0R931_KALFE
MDCKILRSFSVSSPAARPRLPLHAVASRVSPLTRACSYGGLGVMRCGVSNNFQRLYGSSCSLSRGKLTSCINQRSADYDRSSKFLAKAASGQPLESDQGSFGSKSTWESAKDGIDAFYRFTRPHTVIGTTLSIMSVSLLAIEKFSDLSPLFFMGVLEAVVAALFMNVYIVGLNQLSDIEIDKVDNSSYPL